MGFIADIFAADKAADAHKDASREASKASQYATDQTVKLNREIFDKVWNGTAIQREAGDAATKLMAQIMGLKLPSQTQPQTLPQTQPQAPSGPQTQPRVSRPVPGGYNGGEMPGLGGGMALPQFAMAADANALAPTASFKGMGANTQPLAAPPGAGPQVQPMATPGNALGGGPLAGATGGAGEQPFDVTAWLRSTPGYEANLREGLRATNTGLASQGRLFPGDAAREVTRFGQEYADRTFGDQFNRLAAIAGSGQTATSQGSAAGQSYAGNVGNALSQNAANLSSSYQNAGNATSGFWGSVSGSLPDFGQIAGAYKKGGWSGALGALF